MKANLRHKWTIYLFGAPIDGIFWLAKNPDGTPQHARIKFTGTIDEVLAEADEQDSEVDWDVHQIIITRSAANKEGQK